MFVDLAASCSNNKDRAFRGLRTIVLKRAKWLKVVGGVSYSLFRFLFLFWTDSVEFPDLYSSNCLRKVSGCQIGYFFSLRHKVVLNFLVENASHPSRNFIDFEATKEMWEKMTRRIGNHTALRQSHSSTATLVVELIMKIKT